MSENADQEAKEKARALIAEDKKAIPYRPKIGVKLESITAAVLFQQMFYLALHSNGAFYKFASPCPNHPKYRPGDSWEEELGLTWKRFRNAREKIAMGRLREVKEEDQSEEQKKRRTSDEKRIAKALFVFWTDKNRVTFYQANWHAIIGFLNETYSPKGQLATADQRELTANLPKGDYPYTESTDKENARERKKEKSVQTYRGVCDPPEPPAPSSSIPAKEPVAGPEKETTPGEKGHGQRRVEELNRQWDERERCRKRKQASDSGDWDPEE